MEGIRTDSENREFTISMPDANTLQLASGKYVFKGRYAGVHDNRYIFYGMVKGLSLWMMTAYYLKEGPLLADQAKDLGHRYFRPATVPLKLDVTKNGGIITIFVPEFSVDHSSASRPVFTHTGFEVWETLVR